MASQTTPQPNRKRQTAQIFISYSRSDRLAIDHLFEDLHQHHYVLWMDVDEQGIEPGEAWQQELVKQMTASEAVIACVSPDFLRSKYCRAEIEQAKSENKPIYPVLMRRLDEGQSLADMGLDHLQFVDLTAGYDDGLKRLMNVLPRPSFQFKVWWERFGLMVAGVGALLLVLLIAVFGSALATTITTPTVTPFPPTPTWYARADIGVGVAYFSLGGENVDADKARSLAESFGVQLCDQLDTLVDRMQVSLQCIGPEALGQVFGQDDETRELSVQQIMRDHNLDIVVYGVVERDRNNQLVLQPRFYALPSNIAGAADLVGGGRFGKPIPVSLDLDAEDELTARTRAVALILDGLAKFIDQDYQDALAAFESVRSLAGWEDLLGREVVNVLVGNARLRIAAGANDECDRDTVLEQTEQAIREYRDADAIAEEPYGRPFSGLAAAYYFQARWQRETNAADCSQPDYDFDLLFDALGFIERARDQRDPSLRLPFVQAALLTNESRILYAICFYLIPGESISQAEVDDYCQQFDATSEELVGLYQEDRSSTLALFAVETYLMRGDIAQFFGDYRRAIEEYDNALDIDGITPFLQMQITGYQGDANYWLGDYRAAAELYEEARGMSLDYGFDDWTDMFAALRDTADGQLQTASGDSEEPSTSNSTQDQSTPEMEDEEQS
jgi:tetratricopeptide (TPR) repeat protein